MKKALVLGGGYAGLCAARQLSRHGVNTTLIDSRDSHESLPLLPDLIGRRLRPEGLRYPYRRAARRWGFEFRQQTVLEIDIRNRQVRTDNEVHSADGLVLATGMQTAFHGMEQARRHALRFRSVADALLLLKNLETFPSNAVVCGGGYTGVELATAIWRWSRKMKHPLRVFLVELSPVLCPGLPKSFQEYVARELHRLGLEIRTGTAVESVTDQSLTLNNGEHLKSALLAWTAGVCAGSPARDLEFEKTGNGRILVDSHLQVAPGIFAAGDASAFLHDGEPLRMGVQFSISAGWVAGANLLRQLTGRPMSRFVPFDPGYLVPMAHGKACGPVMGVRIYGRAALLLHFLMCVYRNLGNSNRVKVLTDLARSIFR